MRRISSEDLKRLYAPAPRSLYDGVRDAFAGLPDRREQGKVKKKMSVSFVLAAALLLLSFAALAVDKWDLFKIMTDASAPITPLKGAEELVVGNLGSAENAWVKLTVEQAVYDGQGVMVLARMMPKDIEHDALLSDMLDDTPEDIYDVEKNVPVKVAEGEQAYGEFEVVNLPGEVRLRVNGEAVDIPVDRAAAEAAGYPVYLEGGALYYADQYEYRVQGRKDGRRIVGYWAGLEAVTEGADAEAVEALEYLTDGMSMDAEPQPDGSELIWFDCFGEQALPQTVALRLRSGVTVDGESHPLDDIVFTLDRAEAERVVRLMPENGGDIAGRVCVRDVSVNLTKVRAYLTIDFDYEPAEGEVMGVSFRIYDEEGNRITTGSGWETPPDSGLGFYRWQMEMQSMEAVPDVLVLEAKVIDGEPLGRCVCRTAEEDARE